MNCAKFLSGLTWNVKYRTSACRLVPRRSPWSRPSYLNPRGPPSVRGQAPVLADGGCPGCRWRWLDWWRHHVTHPAPGVGRGVLYDELSTPRSRSVGFFRCALFIPTTYGIRRKRLVEGGGGELTHPPLCFWWYLVQKY